MTQPDATPAHAACAAAEWTEGLPPGPLAQLRRMTEETAAPEFWRLAARYRNTIGRRDKRREWLIIVRILATLTQKGDPAHRHSLHDSRRRLGAVLCDGGTRNWPLNKGGTPRPVFSERRLAQLMAARGPQRAVLLERAARVLARTRDPDNGVNVVDIAYTLLAPNNGRQLAEHYYGRLDRAAHDAEQSEEGTE